MNEKFRALGKNVSEQYLFFYGHTNVYCVYTRNLGANLWLLLGAKSMPFGCMSMARLGAKSAVQSIWILLGACLCLLGACLWLGWVQSLRKLGASLWRVLGACLCLLGACLWLGWVHA